MIPSIRLSTFVTLGLMTASFVGLCPLCPWLFVRARAVTPQSSDHHARQAPNAEPHRPSNRTRKPSACRSCGACQLFLPFFFKPLMWQAGRCKGRRDPSRRKDRRRALRSGARVTVAAGTSIRQRLTSAFLGRSGAAERVECPPFPQLVP